MKLTFVLPNLRLYGGIKSTIAMADALARRGHDVSLVSPIIPGRDGLGWLNVRKSAAQIYYCGQNLLNPPNWYSFSGQLQRPLVLNAAALPPADILVLTWWADVAALHHAPPEKGQPVHFVRSIETWGGPREKVSAVYQLGIPRIASSADLQSQISRLGGGPINGIIHNGLDVAFDNLAFVERSMANPPRVGVLYRTQDWKRMDDAFAVLDLCRANRSITPVFFGERPSRQHRQQMNTWQAEYHLLPSGRALREVYESLDVFLFTSDATEAFGNPPFEALAASVPVVTTGVGAAKELLSDGETALICDVSDVNALAGCVLALLESQATRRRFAEAGHQVASGLSWDSAASKFDLLLAALVDDTNA